ncbi:Hypothetical predicted protein [Podarcis lilfordi]|nr:Hypothetical predicted protein [Podarcis lilfordi]
MAIMTNGHSLTFSLWVTSREGRGATMTRQGLLFLFFLHGVGLCTVPLHIKYIAAKAFIFLVQSICHFALSFTSTKACIYQYYIHGHTTSKALQEADKSHIQLRSALLSSTTNKEPLAVDRPVEDSLMCCLIF